MGFLVSLDNLFRGIANASPQLKQARPDANAANQIARHLASKWPELVGIPGLWFSGSQVWSWLYGEEPPPSSDTDVFVLKDAAPVVTYEGLGASSLLAAVTRIERSPIGEMFHRLGLQAVDAKTRQVPADKPHYQPNGMDVVVPGRGDFDVWTTVADSVVGQLRMYPPTHAHCRAAFSFSEGLVVLPNEAANV